MDDLAGQDISWADQTVVHPLGMLMLIVLAGFMLTVPRRYAVLPMLVMACFVASAQRVVVGPLDFNFIRILVVVGWCRLLLHGEASGLSWRPIDYAIIAWAVSGTLIYTLQHGTMGALINRLGWSFDSVGMYFLFRLLIREWRDFQTLIVGVALIAFPVAVAFIIEFSTARNAFSIFGGVPTITNERFGRLRCQGPFSHPIIAGSFWAALLPLIAVQWWQSSSRKVLALGSTAAAVGVIYLCASSGPVAAAMFGGLAALAFGLRHRMQQFRWLAIAGLIALHLVMAQPVWHLLTRVNIVGGSTGWHRFMLYDQFIKRVGEWVLIGTTSTRHWGRGLQDVTSQYVLEAVRGGGVTLVIFVLVIALAYREVGRLWRMQENAGHRYRTYLAWAMGVALLIHSVSFISVSYFGQIIVIWFLLLAAVTSLTAQGERAGLTWKRKGPAGTRHAARTPPATLGHGAPAHLRQPMQS